ncbi:hypothetical protein FE257_004601 [Aspergillus nanangensis]|uniref:Uncharacterized protein n=1 Tax=Aspergillus nanangensis TaxID=2582783 RepID=A0AAD4D0A0_ASPNN|nr:hypothetical protein FE257_004601 [Aspergillus nanangensis]
MPKTLGHTILLNNGGFSRRPQISGCLDQMKIQQELESPITAEKLEALTENDSDEEDMGRSLIRGSRGDLPSSKRLLLFARHLALNFSAQPEKQKHVAFRLNARWVEYTLDEVKNRRKLEEGERLRRQVKEFPSSATWNMAPYRNPQGKAMTQWGMMMSREYVQTKGNEIMEHPPQTSFADLLSPSEAGAYRHSSHDHNQDFTESSPTISNI